MKRLTASLLTCILFSITIHAQLSLQDGSSNYLIDFDATLVGVNSGSFAGTGFATTPSSGQLDADAWATTGLSDSNKDFGVSNTSGDHARGSSSGGVSTGGHYSFDIGGGNRALGIQPTGSDWTPGTLTLRIDNNSTSVINEMDVSYRVYVRNDQSRSSSFNFSYSFDHVSYTDVATANYTSAQSSGSTAWQAIDRNILLSNLALAPGASFYLRWSGSDVAGSGSRDEFALDDIQIIAAGATENCTQPTSQASNLSFGVITSNSIQASFNGGTADKYLVVQSTNSSLGASPADGVTYTQGSSLGNGTVLQFSDNTDINSLGLMENTTYYYFIFAAHDNCSGGPDYLASNPLSGSATTSESGNSTYYSSIGNETCENLKTALHNLIKDHTVVSYNSLWTHYQTTDDHLNDAGSETIVWDMYSDNPSGSENEFTFVTEQCGTYQSEGDCYNREHTFPRSWWGGSTSEPQYTDIFAVVPADGWINGVRSNNPYGEVQGGTETQITNNGSKLGSSSTTIPGYSGSVFEPIDAYKGDLARGYLYMATRYEDVIATWENSNTESDAVLDGTSYTVFESWMLNLLISWHNNDPVDQKEIDRNEAIYGIQGNRNPFIDHPEYVALIWGNCDGGDTESPSIPANLIASNTTENATNLSWNNATDNVAVVGYNVYQEGIKVQSLVSSTNTIISGLASGTSYTFYVTAEDAAGNESGNSNNVMVTTSSSDNSAPTSPGNLMANNATETTTDLSWNASTDNVGVTGYNVYQDGTLLTTTTATSVQVTGLTSATTYAYYVTAIDAAGNESSNSNTIDVTTDSPSGPVILHEGYFESGWDGWQDGGSDCARYSGSNSYEGSYSIRIRDNSNTASSMTSPVFDLSSFNAVDLDFHFYPRSMENNEDFWLRYNDGSGWQTIATFTRGVDFNNNVFYAVSITMDAANYNFTNNAQFRFQCDASGNNDQIFIDAVVISGHSGSNSMVSSNIIEAIEFESEDLADSDNSEDNLIDFESDDQFTAYSPIQVFPNPATDYINIDLRSIENEILSIQIMDAMGRVTKSIEHTNASQIIHQDISSLPSGMYFVRVIKGDKSVETIRFQVQ